MARPWRDVLSAEAFASMIEEEDYVKASDTHTKMFRGPRPMDHLRQIHQKLVEYHMVPKRSVGNLMSRRTLLTELSMLAENYLTTFRVDLNQAAQRQTRTVTRGVERRSQTDAKDESLDRNLLTLQRRALRKKKYLNALQMYCLHKDARGFVRFVREEVDQDTSAGLLGISKQNLSEVEDFAHRDGFHHGALLQAFNDWFADATSNHIHFFLWLEEHPICTSQNQTADTYKEVTPVEYVKDGHASEAAKFQLLSMDGGALYKMDNTLMDTYADKYTAETKKCIAENNRWAQGLAAFVWTPNDELFIAQHNPGRFHHSSLLAGQRVKCAGMIGIRAGKIEELSNNSGHYKPGLLHMQAFAVRFQMAFAHNHTIVVTTGANEGYAGNYAGLMAYEPNRPRGATVFENRPRTGTVFGKL